MGPIESLLVDYYTKVLVDFIQKIDSEFQKAFEEKYPLVIKLQMKWAKAPIPELGNKTPLELIKLERKLYRLEDISFF